MTKNAAMPHDKRDQTVLTPVCIRDALLELWPEGVSFDPFPAAGSPVTECVVPGWAGPCYWDGFTVPWLDRTFANPPFARLKEALIHAASHEDRRIVVLAPARTHRAWFWDVARQANDVAFLKPLSFHGEKNTFPYPLCLFYWGNVLPFQAAFKHLSLHFMNGGSPC